MLNHTMPNRHILEILAIWPNQMLYTSPLSGQENLEFFWSAKGFLKKRPKGGNCLYSSSSRSDRLLKQGGIWYSGGMKRRLSLAIALLEILNLIFGRTDSWNRPFSSKENLERIIRA